MEQTAPLDRKTESPLQKRIRLSLKDISDSMRNWTLWTTLGWQDIRLRYRRSALGPLWITISMAVMIYTLGTVYSFLFKTDLASYFPHVACGILVWTFISTTTIELVDTYIEAGHFIRQIKLPFTTYVLRNLARNVIVFFHNLLAVVPLLIYYHKSASPLIALGGLLILCAIAFVYGTALAMLGARYRDIRQLIQSLLQIVFYLTPIMWMPHMLPERFTFVALLNPFYHLIQLIRGPLMGEIPSALTYGCTLGLLGVGCAMMFFLLFRSRHRIAFWI